MTSDQLIEELRKLPPGTTIQYMDFNQNDYKVGSGIDWIDLREGGAVSFQMPEEQGSDVELTELPPRSSS